MSKIEWTDCTWNPTVGCTRVSAGCKNCYAFESHDRRHKGYPWPNAPKQYAKPFSEVQLMPDRLDAPLRWRKPRRVFVNSMSDLFHEAVNFRFVDKVFAAMSIAQGHTFQVLTKRPARMHEYVHTRKNMMSDGPNPVLIQQRALAKGHGPTKMNIAASICWPLTNVWLGVSVEDQATADERIPLLLDTPAAVRFLSCEPLLGPVSLAKWMRHPSALTALTETTPSGKSLWQCETCGNKTPGAERECFTIAMAHNPIHWVIVGGESGPKARYCDLTWVRSLVRQCKTASVPVFVKQLGSHVRMTIEDWRSILVTDRWEDGRAYLTDRKGGDMYEWPEDLRVREYPA
jgi:protein gp37